MNFYKEFFLTTLEICIAIFLIIFGYEVWDNFDQTEYNTAKYYDNINEFEIYMEDTQNYISFIENEKNIESTKLYLHNISKNKNITKLILKTYKNDNYIKNNVTIKINDKYYELKKLTCIEDDIFCYLIIDNIEFKGYETKEYDVKILFNNNYDLKNENINYEFIAQV